MVFVTTEISNIPLVGVLDYCLQPDHREILDNVLYVSPALETRKLRITSMATSSLKVSHAAIPRIYKAFFLYIEPISTIVGAYYAFFQQQTYLDQTHSLSAPITGIPVSTSIVLGQLSNLYLLFALNEALVLRATSDLRVWRTMLLCLLIADVGHLYSVKPLRLQIYWNIMEWNAIDWGNIGFVYAGASTRVAFLLGFGFSPLSSPSRRRQGTRRS